MEIAYGSTISMMATGLTHTKVYTAHYVGLMGLRVAIGDGPAPISSFTSAVITGPVTITHITSVGSVTKSTTVHITELPPPPSSITSILTVRYQLTALIAKHFTAFPLTVGMTIWADPSNVGLIYLGGVTVSTNSRGPLTWWFGHDPRLHSRRVLCRRDPYR